MITKNGAKIKNHTHLIKSINRLQLINEKMAKKYACKITFSATGPDGKPLGPEVVMADGTK